MYGLQSQSEHTYPKSKFRASPRAICIRSVSSLNTVYKDLLAVGFVEQPEESLIVFPGTSVECAVHSFSKVDDLDIAILFPRSEALDKCFISVFDHKSEPEREILFRFDCEGIIDGKAHLGKCYFPRGESTSPWDRNGCMRIYDFQIRMIENRAQVFVNGDVAIGLLR
jgi:hypothetical protein